MTGRSKPAVQRRPERRHLPREIRRQRPPDAGSEATQPPAIAGDHDWFAVHIQNPAAVFPPEPDAAFTFRFVPHISKFGSPDAQRS